MEAVKSIQRKKLLAYKTVVFDLDGTLYYQRTLRLRMAARLLWYYICHPLHAGELLLIKRFRSVREHWDSIANKRSGDNLDIAQYAYVAEQMHTTSVHVEQVINQWIYENPLTALKKSRDEKAKELIEKLRSSKIPVVIFSDYPIEEKLAALEITADGMYSANEERIMELKPSPKGLTLIMQDFHVSGEDILMIGDRYSKDGMAARNAGVDYIILGKTPKSRAAIYKKLFEELC